MSWQTRSGTNADKALQARVVAFHCPQHALRLDHGRFSEQIVVLSAPCSADVQRPRQRERRDQLAAEPVGLKLGSEFVSDVPGEDHRAVRLVGKQPGFIHHRYLSSRNVLADFE